MATGWQCMVHAYMSLLKVSNLLFLVYFSLLFSITESSTFNLPPTFHFVHYCSREGRNPLWGQSPQQASRQRQALYSFAWVLGLCMSHSHWEFLFTSPNFIQVLIIGSSQCIRLTFVHTIYVVVLSTSSSSKLFHGIIFQPSWFLLEFFPLNLLICKFRGSGKTIFQWKPERWENNSMEKFRTGVLAAIFMSPTVFNTAKPYLIIWLEK